MKNRVSKNFIKYQHFKKANSFIYFLTMMPILNYFFHNDLVAEYEAKEGLSLTLKSISYINSLFKKVLYLMIIVSFTGVQNIDNFAFIFLGLTIAGSIGRRLNEFGMEDYEAIILLRINSLDYVRFIINSYLRDEFILFAFAMLFPASVYKMNYLLLLLMIVIYLF